MSKRTPQHIENEIILLYNKGLLLSEITQMTGSRAVYAVLRRYGHEPQRSPHLRDPEARAHRQEECRNALVSAAAASQSDGGLRLVDYRAWRTNNLDAPNDETIRKTLGGPWREVVAAAGVQPVLSQADRDRLWSEADAVRWMREAATEDGVLTRERYGQWRSSQASPVIKSSGELSRRFGWTWLLTTAGLRRRSGNTPSRISELEI